MRQVLQKIDLPTLIAIAITLSCWASNFPALRFVVKQYDPPQITLFRFLCASLALGVYAVAVRMPLPRLRDIPAFLFFGLIGLTLGSLLVTYGLTTISAGAGSFLVGTVPVFSALLARFFLKERLGPLGWGGIALSMCGLGLIALGESGETGEGFRLNPGVGFLLLSAFFQSIFYVFQKQLYTRYTPQQLMCWSIWCATAWLLVFAPDLPAALYNADMAYTAVAVYIGLFPTAIGFLCWAYALSRAKAAKVTSAMYVMPGLVILLAFLLLGEVPALLSLVGGLVAIAGVVLLNVWGR